MARPNKPTNLKLIEGNKGKRALNTHEPDPAYLNDLSAADWLPDGAKIVWNEIAPALRKERLLTVLDIPALETGCVAIANYRKLTIEIGSNFITGNAISQKLIAQSMYFKQAMGIFQQFGMSPAARTRIAIQPQGDLFATEQSKASQHF